MSPINACRDTKSSPSVSPARMVPSSNPSKHTTLEGTPRNGTEDVAVIAPVRNGWRPGALEICSSNCSTKCSNVTVSAAMSIPRASVTYPRKVLMASSASSSSPLLLTANAKRVSCTASAHSITGNSVVVLAKISSDDIADTMAERRPTDSRSAASRSGNGTAPPKSISGSASGKRAPTRARCNPATQVWADASDSTPKRLRCPEDAPQRIRVRSIRRYHDATSSAEAPNCCITNGDVATVMMSVMLNRPVTTVSKLFSNDAPSSTCRKPRSATMNGNGFPATLRLNAASSNGDAASTSAQITTTSCGSRSLMSWNACRIASRAIST